VLKNELSQAYKNNIIQLLNNKTKRIKNSLELVKIVDQIDNYFYWNCKD